MIILIDNYDSFTYNVYQLLAATYPHIEVFRNDKISVEEIVGRKPKGIVISPGPGRPEDAGITCSLIKQCYQSIPILGICLGHQAIGKVFEGNVILAPKVVHGKKTTIFHGRNGLFAGLPLPFEGGRYHSLLVERETLPQVLMIDAESSSGEIMAISHKSFPVFGIQFHPESILTSVGPQIIHNFLLECGCAT